MESVGKGRNSIKLIALVPLASAIIAFSIMKARTEGTAANSIVTSTNPAQTLSISTAPSASATGIVGTSTRTTKASGKKIDKKIKETAIKKDLKEATTSYNGDNMASSPLPSSTTGPMLLAPVTPKDVIDKLPPILKAIMTPEEMKKFDTFVRNAKEEKFEKIVVSTPSSSNDYIPTVLPAGTSAQIILNEKGSQNIKNGFIGIIKNYLKPGVASRGGFTADADSEEIRSAYALLERLLDAYQGKKYAYYFIKQELSVPYGPPKEGEAQRKNYVIIPIQITRTDDRTLSVTKHEQMFKNVTYLNIDDVKEYNLIVTRLVKLAEANKDVENLIKVLDPAKAAASPTFKQCKDLAEMRADILDKLKDKSYAKAHDAVMTGLGKTWSKLDDEVIEVVGKNATVQNIQIYSGLYLTLKSNPFDAAKTKEFDEAYVKISTATRSETTWMLKNILKIDSNVEEMHAEINKLREGKQSIDKGLKDLNEIENKMANAKLAGDKATYEENRDKGSDLLKQLKKYQKDRAMNNEDGKTYKGLDERFKFVENLQFRPTSKQSEVKTSTSTATGVIVSTPTATVKPEEKKKAKAEVNKTKLEVTIATAPTAAVTAAAKKEADLKKAIMAEQNKLNEYLNEMATAKNAGETDKYNDITRKSSTSIIKMEDYKKKNLLDTEATENYDLLKKRYASIISAPAAKVERKEVKTGFETKVTTPTAKQVAPVTKVEVKKEEKRDTKKVIEEEQYQLNTIINEMIIAKNAGNMKKYEENFKTGLKLLDTMENHKNKKEFDKEGEDNYTFLRTRFESILAKPATGPVKVEKKETKETKTALETKPTAPAPKTEVKKEEKKTVLTVVIKDDLSKKLDEIAKQAGEKAKDLNAILDPLDANKRKKALNLIRDIEKGWTDWNGKYTEDEVNAIVTVLKQTMK